MASGSARPPVPNTVLDPVWSLRPWSLHVQLGGQEFDVPALPAADWLASLMADDGDISDIFPGWLSLDDQDDVMDMLIDGVASMEDLNNLGLDVLTQAGGRPWWVTLRLVGTAKAAWATLGAALLLDGIDAEKLSLSAWLDVLLLTIMRMIDDEHATMFVMKLEAVPAGYTEQLPEPEISADSFLAMA